MKIRYLSVSEVNDYINKSIKTDPILQCISVYGEISNSRFSTGGYLFFSLKDINSKLDCVCFEPETLDINIESGIEVELVGTLNFYQKDGSFKLMVKEAKAVGIGKAFEKYLKIAKILKEEGLFLSSKKKKINEFPNKLGVITSKTGAVLQDILNVSKTRYPQCEIVVYPCKVQGTGTAESIVKGIDFFNEKEEVDTIIIARGGGSYEDLIEFNDEALARAVSESKIPIISAIGHETDNTILDLVADLRASTPSMAAELALPSKKYLYNELNSIFEIMNKVFHSKIDSKNKFLLNLNISLESHSPLTIQKRRSDELDNIKRNLIISLSRKMTLIEKEVDSLGKTLGLINPILPYEKGFAVIRKKNMVITSIDNLDLGDKIDISFKDGNISAIVK
ncbi:MAG: exodeoxyribonuclease VII large subunit [Filifactoraceae bacterium]